MYGKRTEKGELFLHQKTKPASEGGNNRTLFCSFFFKIISKNRSEKSSITGRVSSGIFRKAMQLSRKIRQDNFKMSSLFTIKLT